MGKRNSKSGCKKSNSKKHREKNSKSNVSKKEEKNSQQSKYIDSNESTSQDSVKDESSDIHTEQVRPLADDLNNLFFETTSKTSSNTESETSSTDTNADTECCKEIKEKQQEMLNKLKNLTESLTAITLIRDNVNSIRVDTLTELYFVRQVRPLLDALNIISFASTNMSSVATSIQATTFGESKEVKNALKLSYKMIGEVDDIINSLGRRLTIFLKQIDNIDKNCPPFDSRKDS